MIDDKRYRKHRIFEEVNNYIEFYDSLSMSVCGFIA
jgi:hypothetical protein